jgi:hypothetical protein
MGFLAVSLMNTLDDKEKKYENRVFTPEPPQTMNPSEPPPNEKNKGKSNSSRGKSKAGKRHKAKP